MGAELLVRGFQQQMRALCRPFESGTGQLPLLGLALSGGSDSMALAQLCREAGVPLAGCLHVDHRLRRESAQEAAAVQRWACERLRLPCEVASMPWPAGEAPVPPSSASRRARELRREALAAWARRKGLSLVLMAHHAGDQAETLFMRIAQQTGLQGLQCIRPLAPLHSVASEIRFTFSSDAARSEEQVEKERELEGERKRREDRQRGKRRPPEYPVWLVRPLLSVRKEQLRGFCQERGVPFLPSPENDDPTLNSRQACRQVLSSHPELEALALRSVAGVAALNGRLDAEVQAFLLTHSSLYHAVPGCPIELDLRALATRFHPEHLFRVLEILNHDIGLQPFGVPVAQIERFLRTHLRAFISTGKLAHRVTLGCLLLQSLGSGWVIILNANHPQHL